MKVIRKDSNSYTKNGIYKYFIVNNVKNYCYDNFNTCFINNSEEEIKLLNYYLILDFPFSNAVFHWIAECCIYFELFHKLKQQYPSLKLVFLIKKEYHELICKFFNIHNSDIVYSIEPNNCCIFPLPISMLNDPTISEDYKLYSTYILKEFNTIDYKKNIDILVLPRQSKQNHHMRLNNCFDIVNNIKNKVILNTDDVTDFYIQIKLIKQSKTIIVSDGSAFLLNGLFSCNSKIIVLGDVVISQANDHLKMKFFYDYILRNNEVIFIPYLHGDFNNNNFLYEDIISYL